MTRRSRRPWQRISSSIISRPRKLSSWCCRGRIRTRSQYLRTRLSKADQAEGARVVTLFALRQTEAMPIGWKSAVVRRVVISSFSAELINSCSALDDGVWSAALLSDVWGVKVEVAAFSDRRSVVSNSTSLRLLQARVKALTRYMYWLRDMLASQEVKSLRFVSTRDMIADGMTRRSTTRRNQLLDFMNGRIRID